MTDPQDPVEGRLADWFGAEVRRAERDWTVGVSVRVAEPRRRSVLPVTAVLAAVVVLLLVVSLRPAALPPPQPGDATAHPSSSSISEKGVVLGEDGLPITIDGERVVRLADLSSALAADHDALVAGWHQFLLFRCRVGPPANEPQSVLLPWCNPYRLAPRPDSLPEETLELVVENEKVFIGAVVLRVHDDDPRAADCGPDRRQRCGEAIVVDEVAWTGPSDATVTARAADGIPSRIDAAEVLRPGDLAVRDFAGDQTFLLGGWHGSDTWRGCGRLGETHPLLDDCSPEWITGQPGRPGTVLMQARLVPHGPVVLRVHRNDPRSATCPDRERDLCRERVVVDQVVWAGDDETLAMPLDILDVVTRLGPVVAAGPGFHAVVDEIDAPVCDPGFPAPMWRAVGTERIGSLLLFRSIEDREDVGDNLRADGWTGRGGCRVLTDAQFAWRWVAVDNVVVQVNLTVPDGTAEERLFAEAVRAALTAPTAP
jgi:hypothetical protein